MAVIAAKERAAGELEVAQRDLRREQFEAAAAYVASTKRPDTTKARARVAELESLLAGLERLMVYAEYKQFGETSQVGTASRLTVIEMRDPELGAILRAELREKAANEAKAAAVCGDPRRTERVAK